MGGITARQETNERTFQRAVLKLKRLQSQIDSHAHPVTSLMIKCKL